MYKKIKIKIIIMMIIIIIIMMIIIIIIMMMMILMIINRPSAGNRASVVCNRVHQLITTTT